ncbi:hypothetical protein ACFFS2_25945 [Streptomyces aurantiacus]|nr:hypothetical protein [Streptomyces aurantiacus]
MTSTGTSTDPTAGRTGLPKPSDINANAGAHASARAASARTK